MGPWHQWAEGKVALHPLALTPDSIPSPSDAGFPGSNLEGAVVPHMQQWMLEASRSFQGLWVTVGTRSGLGDLVNVKTSNSLYLKTQGYFSRCKLNTKSRKWSYWSAWQQTLGVPPPSAFFTVQPLPPPLSQHCDSSGSTLPLLLSCLTSFSVF